jgi:hypothetical protein
VLVLNAAATLNQDVVAKLSMTRLATPKYAMDLDRAKADGYTIIAQMIPNKAYIGFTSRNKGRGR